MRGWKKLSHSTCVFIVAWGPSSVHLSHSYRLHRAALWLLVDCLCMIKSTRLPSLEVGCTHFREEIRYKVMNFLSNINLYGVENIRPLWNVQISGFSVIVSMFTYKRPPVDVPHYRESLQHQCSAAFEVRWAVSPSVHSETPMEGCERITKEEGKWRYTS